MNVLGRMVWLEGKPAKINESGNQSGDDRCGTGGDSRLAPTPCEQCPRSLQNIDASFDSVQRIVSRFAQRVQRLTDAFLPRYDFIHARIGGINSLIDALDGNQHISARYATTIGGGLGWDFLSGGHGPSSMPGRQVVVKELG